MTRHIRIHLESRDVACTARLLEDDAPATSAAVWEALPQRGDAFHAKYARNEVYTLVPAFEHPPGPENSTITPIPGDVVLFSFSGTELASASHGYGEGRGPGGGDAVVDLAVFYERNNLLLNPDVGWVPGSVFATVTGGLDAFAEACRDLWRNGFAGERLAFSRADDDAGG